MAGWKGCLPRSSTSAADCHNRAEAFNHRGQSVAEPQPKFFEPQRAQRSGATTKTKIHHGVTETRSHGESKVKILTTEVTEKTRRTQRNTKEF